MASSKQVQGRSSELRVVLLGRAGDGMSASGNTILGSEEFQSDASSSSLTKECMKKTAVVAGRHVSVVDTPGFFHTDLSEDEVKLEIGRCVSLSSPGPHAFLLVMPLGPYTKQEKEIVQEIQKMFSEKVMRFTLILFTRADDLEKGMTIKKYLKSSQELQELVTKCGGCHAFNNKEENPTQVTELLEKIESMVAENGGSHYTDEMYQQAQTAIRQEKEEICGCAPMCLCL
ncbi:GTPase IMAP family member 4-like [Acipenser ruthenus]|uniref:GTPase IMAP family member 4-like n=1 Tax=Acipenser ruthenus TaxID=7906 RepID=UPI002741E0E2|nr:GTPase IMAP family member 4-like [Acipenser ruthenus]